VNTQQALLPRDQPFHSKGNVATLRQVSWLTVIAFLSFPVFHQWIIEVGSCLQ